MEHIIQFGITIDDEAIKNLIVNKASETVVKEVKKELGVDRGYYSDNVLRCMISSEVIAQFIEHKDAIITETSKRLAEKLVRTKAVKDATVKVIEKFIQEEN